MATPAKLRDQARAAENRGQWTEAVVLYRQLLEENEGEEVDIALWNRVGDLHLRLNETERAVEAYERAASAYADSGLYNNAIALCRKILRLVPGRGAVYLKLGQISAAAGFLADARQNFLEYAQRMRRAGNLDASFEALREFADLSPDDTEVRKLLADQLLANGRRDQAVEQLRVLMGAYLQAGDAAAADAAREQIHAVAPDADDSPLMRSSRNAARDDFSAALHDGDFSAAGPGDVAPLAGLETTALDDGSGAAAPLAGLESTSLLDDPPPPPSPAAGLELALEPTLLDGGGDEDAGEPIAFLADDGTEDDGDRSWGGDLPLLDADDQDGGDLPLLDADDQDGGDLPLLIDEDDADSGDDGGLPLIGFDNEPARYAPPPRRAPEPVVEAAADNLEQLRAHVAAVPADEASREQLVRELRARGLGHEVPDVLEAAHRALAARGMYFEAVAPITALLGLRPDNGMLLQKRVEYAFRSGRADVQVEAYLGLGRHLALHGQEGKAAAVFNRVLELDPHNVEGRAAAAQVAPLLRPPAPPAPAPAAPAPAPPPPPAPAPPPANEYVDLGALIMDDGEEGEASTRFVVEEKEPSGDEDKDFAEMLAHFRQKVSENIDVEDSASHYDLGVAFMEMGLVDEAIAEFQVALRGGANPLATLELLGQCFVDKAQYAVASRVLDRALNLPGAADGDLVGVLYLLGRVDEGTGRPESAVDYYERVVSVDIRFRDTAQRIERLRGVTK
ncbi:MAG TPA: tetratricopeptide repeat protein [Longimicrobium sp.]|jgi:tetratricopeptide (TPR) repeat protein|uniref:tetratricopeptide repeat protein n=1 Tax=Longimicrobium sp. TaxID=2029185 RepID=UPI002ED7E7E9